MEESLNQVNKTLSWQEGDNTDSHKVNFDITVKQSNMMNNIEEIFKFIDKFLERLHNHEENTTKRIKFI